MQPMYQKIADDIRAQIKAGVLRPGQKLPTTRELCERYDVSEIVIRMAMVVLKSEDLVIGAQGRGVYVKQPDD